MTSQTKAGTEANPNISALVDGQMADAADVLNPLLDLETAVDRARSTLSVSDNDNHIKHLNDALAVGSGITKSIANPSGDEQLQLLIDTAIVVTLSDLQTLANKTLTSPTISATGWLNANHAHTSTATGGQLNASSVFNTGTVPVARLPLLLGTNGAIPGTAGLVPAPLAADLGKVLGADGTWKTVAGTGTVTSVGLTLPAEFSVTGSPVTAAGTLAASWANQSGRKVLISPSGGGSGAPSFRALEEADIPALTNSRISDKALTKIVAFAQAGAGGVSNFDIHPPIPAGYEHLLLVVALRTNNSGTSDAVLLRFNNDAAAGNYYSMGQRVAHSASLVTNEALGTVGGLRMHAVATTNNSASNLFGFLTIWIHNYLNTGLSGTLRTMAKWEGINPGTSTGEILTTQGGGHYTAGGAVTRIQLYPLNGTLFAEDSSYALYGVG